MSWLVDLAMVAIVVAVAAVFIALLFAGSRK